MPAISIFSDNPEIQRQAEKLILDLAGSQPDTLKTECCDTFSGFLSSAKKAPRRILLLIQEGQRA